MIVKISTSAWITASATLVLVVFAAAAGVAQEIYAGGYHQQTGEALYRGLCQGCHMSDAKGATGAGTYPALANNARLVAEIYPITVVVHGQRAMPSFGADLSDEQIANVLNYVRTHFGNRYKDVIHARCSEGLPGLTRGVLEHLAIFRMLEDLGSGSPNWPQFFFRQQGEFVALVLRARLTGFAVAHQPHRFEGL